MDLSTITEPQIKVIDKDTAIRYRVTEEKIDLALLKLEKEQLETELAMVEPTEKELAEIGKSVHPYFLQDVGGMKLRIDAIDDILGVK